MLCHCYVSAYSFKRHSLLSIFIWFLEMFLRPTFVCSTIHFLEGFGLTRDYLIGMENIKNMVGPTEWMVEKWSSRRDAMQHSYGLRMTLNEFTPILHLTHAYVRERDFKSMDNQRKQTSKRCLLVRTLTAACKNELSESKLTWEDGRKCPMWLLIEWEKGW